MNNITCVSNEKCIGCGVCCVNCSVSAITMKKGEDGFFYPEVQQEKCVSCGICLEKCSIQSSVSRWANDSNVAMIFSGRYKEKHKVCASSSGGVASAIAEEIIARNGVVYGVAYANDFRSAEYVAVETIEGIEKLKTSKYVQANSPDFRKIESQLLEGKEVMFVGLPCLCDALYRFVGEENSHNLLLVSLVCHGPTSPIVLEKYVEEIEKKYRKKVINMSLRYKKNGRSQPTRIRILFSGNKEKILPFNTSDFGLAFDILYRKSCCGCLSKYPYGAADVIIGDYWYGSGEKYNQSKSGESLIIVRNFEKFKQLGLLENSEFVISTSTMEGLDKKNPAIFMPVGEIGKRDVFVYDLNRMTLHEAVTKNISGAKLFYKKVWFVMRAIIPTTVWNWFRTYIKR